MLPIVHVRELKGLSNYKARRVCDHTPKCKDYVIITTLNDCLTLCEKDAIAYSQTVLSELHVRPEITVRGWTPEQIETLTEFLHTHHEIEKGALKELAEELKKTPKQVKDKIYHLRKSACL